MKIEQEALIKLQEKFKESLTDRMVRDSSKMPTFEDGFYEGISFLSYNIFKTCGLGMSEGLIESDIINAMEKYVELLGQILISSKAYHLATHLYESGSPECAAVKNIEQKMTISNNIAKELIKKEVAEVLGTFPSAKKNWTN